MCPTINEGNVAQCLDSSTGSRELVRGEDYAWTATPFPTRRGGDDGRRTHARGATAQQRFTIETFKKFVGVGGVQLSPDGKTAVITVSRPDYDTDKTNSELYAGCDADLVAAHGRR